MTTAPAAPAVLPAGSAGSAPYQSYVYAYPHKTAYRELPDRPPLRELWAGESQHALSLYLHIPFCEVRCGFCNLFTRIGGPDGLTTAYLDALDRQAGAVRAALDEGAGFALAAFGGGTPTYLSAAELERLCDIAEHRMGADLRAIPLSVEASPATATADRLAVLAERGTTRLSLGVQSFVDAEARSAVRPQKRAEVEAALGRIRDAGFPVLNIDLIYGIDGQTEASWLRSLDAALAWRPEELYLYPLYVRPLTGLARRGEAESPAQWDTRRLALYRVGPRPSARPRLRAGVDADVPPGGRAAGRGERVRLPDGRHGRPRLRRPLLHLPSALLLRLRGGRDGGAPHHRRLRGDPGVRPRGGRPGDDTAGGDAGTSCSRCSRRRGWRSPTTGTASAAPRPRTSRPSSRPSPHAAGWRRTRTVRVPSPPSGSGSRPRAWRTRTRSARCCSRPRSAR